MTSIKKEIVKGSFWIGIAKYSGIVIQLLITAVLARLISPEAFGTITVAMVILHFLNILADIGIGPAIVQYRQLSQNHLNSLFTLNIYIGVFLATLLFFFSDTISSYYNDVALVKVCQMMALVLLFNSLDVVPKSLMRKNKRFRAIAIRTIFFQTVSGSVAVWGAFHGWGIYALIISPILSAIGVFLVNYYNYPLCPVLRMNGEAIKMVSSFSTFQFAFSFFNYFSRNLDKLIIGKFFSLAQLGYYDKSYHLMVLPLQNITFVIEPVLHPILSSLQENKRDLAKINQKIAIIISNISFPIGLILFFCGGEIIRIVYGKQWDLAIPVFRVLALSLPLQMIQSTSGAIYQAAGNTNHMFYNGILNTSITVGGFLIAAIFFQSLESMAWAWDITLFVNFINSYFILHHFTLSESAKPFFMSLKNQIVNSMVVFSIISILSYYIQDLNIIISLLLKSSLTIILTLFMASVLNQYQMKEIINNVIKRIR